MNASLPKFKDAGQELQSRLLAIAQAHKRDIAFVWRLWREYARKGLPAQEFEIRYGAKLEGKNRVVVEVRGGIAEVTLCPDHISVEIIDHDVR